jgi:hypothetical protein
MIAGAENNQAMMDSSRRNLADLTILVFAAIGILQLKKCSTNTSDWSAQTRKQLLTGLSFSKDRRQASCLYLSLIIRAADIRCCP